MAHGWSFDGDGALCRLPDGPSFVGLDGHAVSLRRVAVERCGALVFVNLDEGASSFQGALPDGGAELRARFGSHRVVDRWTTTHAVDWKVIVENTVESYHVPSVHPQTFHAFRPPELHDHRLWECGTRYADLKPWGREPAGLVARVLGALFSQGPVNRFVHTHYFPTTMTYANELVSTVMRVMPAADGTTTVTLTSCVDDRLRWRALRPLQWAFGHVFSRLGRRIVAEDMRLWPHVQRGLQASHFAGVLGAREERVHAFQRFVVQLRADGEASAEGATSGSMAASTPASTLVSLPSSPLRSRRRG
jgi:choline monooxygenase